MKQSIARTFLKNLSYAIFAQGISLILSLLMSLLVPKMLGVEGYSYWQLFIFYTSYTGLTCFGLHDGIYLRLGGTEYNELNKPLLGTQLKILSVFQLFISILFFIYAIKFEHDLNRKFVIIFTGIFMVIFNIATFFNYIFQLTNKTKYYSISVTISRIIFMIAIVLFLAFKVDNYKFFIMFYCLTQFVSLVYCIYIGKGIVFSKIYNIKESLFEMWENVKCGINLTISNIASTLIIGGSRFIVDRAWGIETFGKLSFAITITNFFLVFITQISIVLFPSLRQVSEEQCGNIFNISKNILGPFLCAILLFYIPIKYVLGLWLPQYQESLQYLAIMLPLCIFDGKMKLLCNTYLKVFRKEKVLLYINLITFFLNIILALIGVYLFKNIYFVISFMVISVAIRSIISEIYLSKLLKQSVIKEVAFECLLNIVFVVSTIFANGVQAFVIYLISYLMYILLFKNRIFRSVLDIKNIIKNKL